MASYTDLLNLLKKNPETDGSDTFNIGSMLNDNWDKIDAFAALLMASLAPPYSSTSAYAVGTYCTHGGRLYRCTTAIGTGGEAWNVAHWASADVGALIAEIVEELSNDYAPKSHASSAETYGKGTDSNYGHVKLSDSTTGTSDTSGGTAATPKAVKAVKDAIPSAYTSNPAMDGTASAGSSANWARGDHVHPTDTSRAASSHNHAASNITSGTLGVARGGTGKSSVTANSFLVGNGTSAMVEKTAANVISLLGVSRVQYGSYKGTGTYGSSNQNTLSLNFTPKLVIIGAGSTAYKNRILVNGSGGNEFNQTTWSGTTVKWYSNSAPAQFNDPTYTYYWIAFG